MKIARIGELGSERPAVIDGDNAIYVDSLVSDWDRSNLEAGGYLRVANADLNSLPRTPLAGLRYGAVINKPTKIICVGLNYLGHIKEAGFDTPPEPVIFMKAPDSITGPNDPIVVPLNSALHSWTIENLVKNAIDAMKGRGKLKVKIVEEGKLVKIYVSDTGKGIPRNQFRSVFEPGFTTKKRGWGLGLSLTKRIVEEYHKGKIKVFDSEIGKGTIMEVSFKK
jgi:hypothetical protein